MIPRQVILRQPIGPQERPCSASVPVPIHVPAAEPAAALEPVPAPY
jgi:hypothetical protein